MSENIFLAGELLRVVPWDCEGVEMPYGHRESFKMWDPAKQKAYEDIRKKVKIPPDSPALVMERIADSESSRSPLYWCIVNGDRLLISHIFLERIQ